MNLIENIKNHLKVYLIIIVFLILLVISYLIYVNNSDHVLASSIVTDELIDKVVENIPSIPDEIKTIKVDVKGYVANPGVYELEENSRVIDAINASGGFIEGYDTSNLNLSKKLKDENVIIVDTSKKEEPITIIEYVYEECHCESFNNACIKEEDVVNYTENNNQETKEELKEEIKEKVEENKKISINTASSEELQTLSGIGESKALSIIKYREENGSFNKIEDIMNVSGIGEAAYSKIKDNIKL